MRDTQNALERPAQRARISQIILDDAKLDASVADRGVVLRDVIGSISALRRPNLGAAC